MSVDTKGVVVTPCKDVFLVSSLIERSLDRLIRFESQLAFPRGADREARASAFRTVESRLASTASGVHFNFVFKGEQRDLCAYFTCDSDHLDLGPNCISLILGYWGEAPVLMKTVLHTLSILGEVYYDENDCDSIELQKLAEYVPTAMHLVRSHTLGSYRVEEWVKLFEEGRTFSGSRTFEEVFGVSQTLIRPLLRIEDFKARGQAIDTLAQTHEPPPLTFMSEFHKASATTA